jgi:hypothetical protein
MITRLLVKRGSYRKKYIKQEGLDRCAERPALQLPLKARGERKRSNGYDLASKAVNCKRVFGGLAEAQLISNR